MSGSERGQSKTQTAFSSICWIVVKTVFYAKIYYEQKLYQAATLLWQNQLTGSRCKISGCRTNERVLPKTNVHMKPLYWNEICIICDKGQRNVDEKEVELRKEKVKESEDSSRWADIESCRQRKHKKQLTAKLLFRKNEAKTCSIWDYRYFLYKPMKIDLKQWVVLLWFYILNL